MRLSYSPANPTNLLTTGIWTDFQTQASGDLIITPDNTGVDQKVGIGTSSVNATYPLTTLHIADNNVNGTGETTTDALNHTYSATTPSGNPWLVYSDLNGTLKNLAAAANSTDVLYGNGTWAPPGGGISIVGADNGCSLDAATGTLVELGQDIGGSGAYLINDREIPQNNFDIYFTEAASHLDDLHNNVAMGNLYPLVPDAARLTVEKTIIANINVAKAGEFTATSQYNNQTAQAYAVVGIATQTTPTGGTIQGGQFQGIGSTIKGTYGVHGKGQRPDLVGPVWGGYFEAVGAPGGPMPPIAFAYGVEGRAQAKVLGTAHYAVYGNLGVACPTWPPVACPTWPTFDYAGYFNGDVLSTTNIFLASDAALKDNIQDITNPMDIINQLNPKSYTFKRDQNPSMQLSDSTHYGILAQELEGILPQLVKNSIHPPVTDSVGNVIYAPVDFKAVNYIELIPFLIAGMKEQQLTIESMQAQLSNCCSGGNRNSNTGGEHGNSTSLDVELKNAKSIILNQNVPNPFAEQTTITYFLTDDVKKAQIFFYDNKGTILKTVDINDKGAGQINVFAADLSSGNYTYTLVADGKVVDTKKMVKTN